MSMVEIKIDDYFFYIVLCRLTRNYCAVQDQEELNQTLRNDRQDFQARDPWRIEEKNLLLFALKAAGLYGNQNLFVRSKVG